MAARIVQLLLALWVLGPTTVLADNPCAADAQWVASPGQRHFMVLAGQSGVFYDGTGPTFVMLIKATPDQADIGVIGMYADTDREPRFGAVPASTYETFMRETSAPGDVMLRLEITGPQFERALGVLSTWDRRVRESALLYSDLALDNILLVKQATEELNRCGATITPYQLDWGLQDDISEHNVPRRIPFEYFKTLKSLNAAKHVPDADMPAALLEPRNPQTKE